MCQRVEAHNLSSLTNKLDLTMQTISLSRIITTIELEPQSNRTSIRCQATRRPLLEDLGLNEGGEIIYDGEI